MKHRSNATDARLPLAIGFLAIIFLVCGFFVWASVTQISGAVVAPGIVKVENERQVIQHPDGGVVGEIRARDGDIVRAGQILVRLDDTFLKSESAIVQRQLLEIYARKSRLEAERDGLSEPDFQNAPDYNMLDADWARGQIEGQASLFAARSVSLVQARRLLREQQSQIESQIGGIEAQLASYERQLVLIAQESASVQNLLDRQLIQSSRLLGLQREEARLAGEIGRLTSALAEARGAISSIEIEALKLSDSRRETAITELRDLHYGEIELEERRLSLNERLARLDLRAPMDGVVFASRVFALQSVVQAAEPMMYLVPEGRPLQVAARINPSDIDQVYAGQQVSLQFTTFSRRITPEIRGDVIRVPPDANSDDVTGTSFYEAVIAPDVDALAELSDVRLLPGMPVEVFLKTEDRTPLTYLTQPLAIYFNRAFRGE